MHSSKNNALFGLKEISKWLIICVYNEEKIYLFNFAITKKISATEFFMGQISFTFRIPSANWGRQKS